MLRIVLAALFVILATSALFGQVSPVARVGANNTFTGDNSFQNAKLRWPETTVAELPAASSNTGRIFIVTNALTAGSCAAGGGSAKSFCRSNGTIYESIGGGDGVGITSVATGCGLTGGPITTTGTVKASEGPNLQTGTTYTYLDTDCGKLVSHSNAAAIAATLPQANSSTFVSGWYMDVQNRGAGTYTMTPTGSTVDGAATLVLSTGQGARIISNGTNYFTMRGGSGAGNLAIEVDGVPIGSKPTVNLKNGLGSGMVGVVTADKVEVTQTIDSAVYLSKATAQAGTPWYCRSTTGNDTYICALGPVLTAYTRGMCLVLDADTANTLTATVNAGPGVLSILNRAGGALATGDITANKPITICHDGTQLIIQGDGAAAGGGDALTANPLSQFAPTTSDQLAGVLTNETGSAGGFVRATSPALVTPDIGAATGTSLNVSGSVDAGFFNVASTTNFNGGTTSFLGRLAAGGATSTAPLKVGTSLPGTCIVGDLFFKSDATAGQNIYQCQATNTWTQQLNSGGTGNGYVMPIGGLVIASPGDNTTYYTGGNFGIAPGTGAAVRRIQIPKAGTATKVCLSFINNGTLGTNENSTVSLRLNNTGTDTTISTVIDNSSASQVIPCLTISVAVAVDDFFEVKWATPAAGWATNPTNVGIFGNIYIE